MYRIKRQNKTVQTVIILFAIVLTTGALTQSATVWGDIRNLDTIHYTDRGRTREMRGTVEKFNRRELQILLLGGQRRTIDSKNVVRIDTNRTPGHRAARLAAANQQYAKASSGYFRLLENGLEDRDWVRREMQYELVLALAAEGKYGLAAREFSKLWASNCPPSYFSAIPLVWTGGFVCSPRNETIAEGWLRSQSDVERLMGASLLIGSGKTEDATKATRQLSQTATNPVAALALCQSLRPRVPKATEEDVQICRQAIDRLNPTVRDGPYYILGRLYAAKGEHQKAAVAAMRVPILFQNPRLAAESLLTAGKSMIKSGLIEDGHRIYKELISSYPQSKAAEEARREITR